MGFGSILGPDYCGMAPSNRGGSEALRAGEVSFYPCSFGDRSKISRFPKYATRWGISSRLLSREAHRSMASSSCHATPHAPQARDKRAHESGNTLFFVTLQLVPTGAHPCPLNHDKTIFESQKLICFCVQVAQGQRQTRNRAQPSAGTIALEGFRAVCQPGSHAMGSSHKQSRQVIGVTIIICPPFRKVPRSFANPEVM